MDTVEDPFEDTIESTSVLCRHRVANVASPVIIMNCVATAYFGCILDLREIAWKCFAEFDPRSFAAAKLRLVDPQSTALLFASGKIVCTGAASEASARVAVTKIYQMVSAIMPPQKTSLLDVDIVNIVGTAHLGYKISLQRTYEWMRDAGDVTVMYSAELFPGLRFEIKKWAQMYLDLSKGTQNVPATKVLAFRQGNVVITGGKCRNDLLVTWRALRTLLRPFKETEKVRCIYLINAH